MEINKNAKYYFEELTKIDDSILFHSVISAKIACAIYAYKNKDFDDNYLEKLNSLFIASFYHDVGKYYIDKNILRSTNTLSEEEKSHINMHVNYSKDILEQTFSKEIAQIAYEHHERNNGKGYPNKLKKDKISDEGKILSIADEFSALIQKRPYKEPLSISQSIEIMEEDKLDSHYLSILKEMNIDEEHCFNENVSLIIPFRYESNLAFYKHNFSHFTLGTYSSNKMSNQTKNVVYKDEDSLSICARYTSKEENKRKVYSVTYASKRYIFAITNNEVLLYEKNIGFLISSILLLLVDNKLPTKEDLAVFYSYLTRMRDSTPIHNIEEFSLQDYFCNLLKADDSLSISFIGNNQPKKPEEKPKVFSNIVFNYKNQDTKDMKTLSYLMSNNISSLLNEQKLIEEQNTIHYISRNGLNIIDGDFSSSFGLNEFLLTYTIILNSFYFQVKEYEKIRQLSLDEDEKHMEETYNKILAFQKEYAYFNLKSEFVLYTRSEKANEIIKDIKSYVDSISFKQKIENDLSSLNNIVSVINAKRKAIIAKEAKRNNKRTTMAVSMATLLITLVSSINGMFSLFKNFSGLSSSEWFLIFAPVCGLIIWVIILIFTIKKMIAE